MSLVKFVFACISIGIKSWHFSSQCTSYKLFYFNQVHVANAVVVTVSRCFCCCCCAGGGGGCYCLCNAFILKCDLSFVSSCSFFFRSIKLKFRVQWIQLIVAKKIIFYVDLHSFIAAIKWRGRINEIKNLTNEIMVWEVFFLFGCNHQLSPQTDKSPKKKFSKHFQWISLRIAMNCIQWNR